MTQTKCFSVFSLLPFCVLFVIGTHWAGNYTFITIFTALLSLRHMEIDKHM